MDGRWTYGLALILVVGVEEGLVDHCCCDGVGVVVVVVEFGFGFEE